VRGAGGADTAREPSALLRVPPLPPRAHWRRAWRGPWLAVSLGSSQRPAGSSFSLCTPAVTTLTACHLFVTGLGLHFAAKCMHMFEPKSMDVKCAARPAVLSSPPHSPSSKAALPVRAAQRNQPRLPQPLACIQQRRVRPHRPAQSPPPHRLSRPSQLLPDDQARNHPLHRRRAAALLRQSVHAGRENHARHPAPCAPSLLLSPLPPVCITQLLLSLRASRSRR